MEAFENITYDELAVGDSANFTRKLGEHELLLFAAVSGDVNPIELDSHSCAKSGFREHIAHGMWSGTLISAALATILPGPGTVYREQSLKFIHPVSLDDTLSVNITVIEKLANNQVKFDCKVMNPGGDIVVEGTAIVTAPSIKITLNESELPEAK